MKKINYLLISILFCIGFSSYAQNLEECETITNPNDTIYIPHHGNNQFLDEFSSALFPEEEQKKTNEAKSIIEYDSPFSAFSFADFAFHIPVKIWIYSDDSGDNPALSDAQAIRLLDSVNKHFKNNETKIQFYLKCAIEHVESTQYNIINSDDEYDQLIDSFHEPRALNWHLIRDVDYADPNDNWGGKARFPWWSDKFRFVQQYGGTLLQTDIRTTVHEIGHTLGLWHTHGDRGFNGDNNNCDQESVSRDFTQDFPCLNELGKKKCESNGDSLCDTDAAPNTAENRHIDLDNANDCNYVGGGTDNWGYSWDPPTKNFMSYLEFGRCRKYFKPQQVTVMHINIITYMNKGSGLAGVPWYNTNHLLLSGAVLPWDVDIIYSSQYITTQSDYTLTIGSQTTIVAQEAIKLLPGFSALHGANFEARIDSTTNCGLIYDGQSYASKSTNFHTSKKENTFYERIEHAKELLRQAFEKKGTWKAIHKEDLALANANVSVFPNPFDDNVSFEFYTQDNATVVLSIYNLQGKMQLQKQVNYDQQGIQLVEVDLSTFPSGVYLYKLAINEQGFNGKIIKK